MGRSGGVDMSAEPISFTVHLSSQQIEAIAAQAAALVAAQLPRASTSPYMTVPEAADLLRSERQRVYDLVSSGRLTRFKDGSRLLVSRIELEGHLAGEATGPVAREARRR
jgi:excisionase family DNA binding protein